MTTNKTLVYKKVPKGFPVAGEHLVVEKREIDLNDVPKGGLLVQVQYASFDPYLRPKMRDPSIKSYAPAFELDEPIVNDTVAKVLKSDSPDFKEGDVIKVFGPIAEYATIADPKAQRALKVQNPHNLDLSVFTGALGMPGLTAWSSLYKIGKPKKGETIFVSSAAGAVGQLVGQIAKKEGLTVIGSVGSEEKLDFITKELGFDAGFNYKKETPEEALKRLAPNGIDIYYENVGGEHLEAALNHLNQFGRIVACGMVSFLTGLDTERLSTLLTRVILLKLPSQSRANRYSFKTDQPVQQVGRFIRHSQPHERHCQTAHHPGLYCRQPRVRPSVLPRASGEVAAVAGGRQLQGQDALYRGH